MGQIVVGEARETSSATVTLVLRFVRERGGDSAVADVLFAADIDQTVEQLEDPSTWIGYDTRIRLFEAVTKIYGTKAMGLIGASAATERFHPLMAQILSAFVSPRSVYQQLPKVVPKFSTTSTLTLIDIGSSSATLRFQLNDGYVPSRLDCQYAQGLFSAVPRIFGLDSANVLEDECQSDGYSACVYRVAWSRRLAWWASRKTGRAADRGFAALREQVQRMQLAEADLVSSDDIGEVLARIVDRAALAVLVPSYAFVMTPPEGGESLVHVSGLDNNRAKAVVARLIAGDDLGSSALVIDVASTRRVYGRLAALYPRGHEPMDSDRALLTAYASHAAAALDLFTALEDSQREERRSTALLALAQELATADDAIGVADAIAAALPIVISCDAAAVLFWDASLANLRTVACAGFTPAEQEMLFTTTITASTAPEVIDILTYRDPVFLEANNVSSAVAALLGAIGSPNIVMVPLLDGEHLMGIAVAVWNTPLTLSMQGTALSHIVGVSRQGATALQNARLLATIRHQSLHDSLTGLPNRMFFSDQLERALSEQQSSDDTGIAVVYCDLDNFKKVNDDFGHGAGDDLLRQTAVRLRAAVRSEDTVSRFGGDEFAVIFSGISDKYEAVRMADRIVDSLNLPFHLDGRYLQISTSVGVVFARNEGRRGEELIAAADAAMYQAKRSGRNQIAVSGDTPPTPEKFSLEAELWMALDRNEMQLHFQPVSNIANPRNIRVIGAEALIRWNHPRLGLLMPAAFLPLAEESRMIVALDLWAVRNACATLAGWAQSGWEDLHMAVNLSSATLVDSLFLSTVRTALAENHLAPHRLILEIVESRALMDLAGVVENLSDLRRLGIRISLDDFGTGFSTLTWLNSLPIDQIKIDRSFIMGIPDWSSVALVQGILTLAQKLKIEVVAEGVENMHQLDVLHEAGYVMAQGYLLGRPAELFDPVELNDRNNGLLAKHDSGPALLRSGDVSKKDSSSKEKIT